MSAFHPLQTRDPALSRAIATKIGRPMTFLKAAPVLCVRDITTSLSYFEKHLGFRLQGSAGEMPSWASLQRDGVEIMLVCGDYPAPAADWAVYIYADDVDALFAELKGRGADLLADPVDKPYGCRELEVRLPDGRLLAFGADTAAV